jgi:hypothetical protein
MCVIITLYFLLSLSCQMKHLKETVFDTFFTDILHKQITNVGRTHVAMTIFSP